MPLRVVFLSQRVPHPPDRGDRISTHHILRHLREIGAHVRVGAFAEDARDEAAAEELRGMVAAVEAPRIHPRARKLACLRGIVTGQPLTLTYFAHRRLARTVRRWLAEDPPDLVFLYSSSMAPFAMQLPRDARGIRRVMHFAELDSDKWRQYAAASGALGRYVYGREARLLLEFERRVAHAVDASLVVSAAERDLFVERIPGIEPAVVPNGVDTDHFASKGDARREPHTVIFTGVMDYEPNVDGVEWFAEEAWPHVRAELPDARFLIVGNRPAPRVERLDGQGGIEVTGWVESTPPWFDRASVAIAPLRLARGLQNKVLEAMSMGLPVVATAAAARGLGEVDDDALIVADDAASIREAVLDLLRDPVAARATGERAAAWVRSHFRWEHSFVRIDAVLRGLGLDVPGARGAREHVR